MENKTVQVYSEKLGKMVDVDVIKKGDESKKVDVDAIKKGDEIFHNVASVMLVVDEEEE